MSCNCATPQVGPTLAGTCGGGQFMLFMGLLEVFLKSQCDLDDPCGRPQFQRNFDQNYDFIVVGGGSAGSVVAARLSEVPSWKVLLIEAGMDEPTGTQVPSMFLNFLGSSIDWDYVTEPEKAACLGYPEQRCQWPRGKVLGGTSVMNGMMYMRGDRKDYDDWAAGGAEGWSYEEVLPYFKRLEDNKQPNMVDMRYHGVGGAMSVGQFPYRPPFADSIIQGGAEMGFKSGDLNGAFRTGFSVAQMMHMNGSRQSSARAFLRPARNRPNLHIMMNATATRVLINKDTKMAYGVEVINTHGNKMIHTANKEIILSGGAVNTPQLLLLSGVGPSEDLKKVGVTPIHELPGVGQNLHNHVAYTVNFALNDSNTYPLNWATAMEYLLFRDGLMSGTGLSQVTAFMNSKYNDASIDHPDLQMFFFGFLAMCSKTGQIGEKADENKRGIGMIPTNLHPKSRGRLTLASNDPLAKPKIFANYLDHPDDVKVVIEGIKFALRLAQTKPLQKYGIQLDTTPVKGCEKLQFGCDEYWECAIRRETAAENHQVGSCKMGAVGDPTAVLNPHLQVQGIDRLRVADASAMPTVPTGNTHSSAVLIGERAAEFIKTQWQNLQYKHFNNHYPLEYTGNFLNGVFHNNEYQPHPEPAARHWRSWK